MTEIITRQPRDIRAERERFTEIMQGYRKIWGAKPFEREAMRFMFDQLGKIDIKSTLRNWLLRLRDSHPTQKGQQAHRSLSGK